MVHLNASDISKAGWSFEGTGKWCLGGKRGLGVCLGDTQSMLSSVHRFSFPGLRWLKAGYFCSVEITI